MYSAARRAAVIAFALLLTGSVLAMPRDAAADAHQFCRANMNLVLSPFDIVFSPIITAKDMYYGLNEVGDEVVIQIVATLPGYLYLNAVQIGGGVIRFASGLFEWIPGLFTLRRDGSTGALFRSQDETWQLWSTEVGPCPIRFGSSYNTINEG